MGAEKISIRHSSQVKDKLRLQKIEEKDKRFFIEKLIYEIEKKNPYTIETEKKAEILLEMENKAIGSVEGSTSHFLLRLSIYLYNT